MSGSLFLKKKVFIISALSLFFFLFYLRKETDSHESHPPTFIKNCKYMLKVSRICYTIISVYRTAIFDKSVFNIFENTYNGKVIFYDYMIKIISVVLELIS